MITGDAMGRPLAEALAESGGSHDLSSLVSISSTAAVFSPTVKQSIMDQLPNVIISEAVGASETGSNGYTLVQRADTQSTRGPTVTAIVDTVVLDEDLRAGRARVGGGGRAGPPGQHPGRVLQGPREVGADLRDAPDGTRYSMPGDFATVDEDGRIMLLGRGSVCINSGGEKIYPEEVEAAIKSHPDVYDVHGGRHRRRPLGQRVVAVVQPRDGRARPSRTSRPTAASSSPATRCPASCTSSTRSSARPSGQARLPMGDADAATRAATRRLERPPCEPEPCEMFGLDLPIFAFSHCRDVVAAVSNAGGLGVLGALAFTPEQLEKELDWIDEHVDGKAVRRRRRDAGLLRRRRRARPGPRWPTQLDEMIPAGHTGLRRGGPRPRTTSRRCRRRRGGRSACSAGPTKAPARTSTSPSPTRSSCSPTRSARRRRTSSTWPTSRG